MSHYSVSLLLVLGLFGAAACSSGSDADTATDTTAPPVEITMPSPSASVEPTSPAQTTVAPTDPATTPDTSALYAAAKPPVEAQLDWFLGLLDADDAPSAAEIEAHFSPAFLDQVPPDVLVDSVASLFTIAESPFTVASVDERASSDVHLAGVLESANGVLIDIAIDVGSDVPHLIDLLILDPRTGLPTDVTAAQLDTEMANQAAESSLGVYDVTDGTCLPVHEIRSEREMHLGSAFKLWVLAELARQIEAGEASWDETIPVTAEHRSDPSGEIYARPDGTEVTLEELAALMISISDNTATDHLMARLGRENVEQIMFEIGVTAAERNIPLLSTGAMVELKFVADEPNADDYRALDAAGRSELLDELEAAVPPWVADPTAVSVTNADGVPQDEPRDLDIEWFGTPGDMCRTHVHLAELATRPGLEPIAEILEINPGAGIPFDIERWPTIRFKGGSEPGVVAVTWWFERDDGRRFVIAGSLADGERAFPQDAAVLTLASAIGLVS